MSAPRALASGWPIAIGIIEGACRHLNDRMGITGARWSSSGAQAILWLRAIRANGDLGAYWNHHIQQEHQRNHQSRCRLPETSLFIDHRRAVNHHRLRYTA